METSLERGNVVDETSHRCVIQELAKLSADPHPLKVNSRISALSSLWETIIKNHQYSKYLSTAYLQLYRTTVLTVLHPDWSEGASREWKNHLLKNIELCGNRLIHAISNSVDACQHLTTLGNRPWGDLGVDWNNLVNGKLDFEDPEVQTYLNTESEDIILGRIHFLLSAKRPNLALCLARYLFMYVNRKRIKKVKNKQESENQVMDNADTSTFYCALNWLTSLLQRKPHFELINEVEILECHDGIQLILGFQKRGTEKSRRIANDLIRIFLVRDILNSKDYCCTRELFGLWCLSMKHYSAHEAATAVRELLGHIAKNSAHFYMCADVFYSQFQASFLPLYVELFIRGLTIDINYLEVTRSEKEQSKIEEIEQHLAYIFDLLSTLFSGLSEIVQRECMLSAYSLCPNTKRLYILQNLTHSILSNGQLKSEWERELNQYDPECSKYSCGQKCSSVCMQKKKLFHPLLTKGIKNIPYALVKDLVIVLESVRCNTFQFNYFDWETVITELGDYLTEGSEKSANRQLQMDYDSDTDCASDGSNSPVSRANRKLESFQASTSKSSQHVYQNGHDHNGSTITTETDCINLSITNSSIPYVAETIEIETETLETKSNRKEPNQHFSLPYENKQHAKIAKKYDNFFKSSSKIVSVSPKNMISDNSKASDVLSNNKIVPFSDQKYSLSSTSPSTTSALAVLKCSSPSYNFQEKETASALYLGNQKAYIKENKNSSSPASLSFSQSSDNINTSENMDTSTQTVSNSKSSHISDVRLYNPMPKKQFMHNNSSMTANNLRQLPSTLEGLGSPYRLMPSIETPNLMLEKRKLDHHLLSADKHSPLEKRFAQEVVTPRLFDETSGKHLQKSKRLLANYPQVQPQNHAVHVKNSIQSEISTPQDLQVKSGTPIVPNIHNAHKIEFTLSNSKSTQCNHPSTSFHSSSLQHSYRQNVAKVSPIINYDQRNTANSSLIPYSKDQNKIKSSDAHGRNSVIQHTMQVQNPVTDKQLNLLPTSQISLSLPPKKEEMGIINPLSVKVSNKKLLSGRDGYINAQLLISCPKGDKQSSENQANSGSKCETTCIPGIIYVRNKSKKINAPGANNPHPNNCLPLKSNFTSNEMQEVSDNVLNKVVKRIIDSSQAHSPSFSKTTSLNSNQPSSHVTELSSNIECDEQIRNKLYSPPLNKSNSTSLSASNVKSWNDKSVQMYNGNSNSHQAIGVSQHQQINSNFPSSTNQSWLSENVTPKNADNSSFKPVVLPTSSSEQRNLTHFTYSRQQQQKLTKPIINSETPLRSLLSSPVAVNPALTVSKSYVPNKATSLNSNANTQSFSTGTVPLPIKQEQTGSFVARSMSSSPIYTAQGRKIACVSVPGKQHISNSAASSTSNNVQDFINYNLSQKQQNQNLVTSASTVKSKNVAVVSTFKQDYVSNITSSTSTVSTPRPFTGYNSSPFSKQQNEASPGGSRSSDYATNHRKVATIPIHHAIKVPTPPVKVSSPNSYSSSIGNRVSTIPQINPSSHNMTTVPSPTPMLTSISSNNGNTTKYWSPEPSQSLMNSTIAVPTSVCCSPHEVQKCQTCKQSEESHPAATPVFHPINASSEIPTVDSSFFHDESLLSPVNPEEQIKDHNEKQNLSSKKKYKKPPIKCDYCNKYLGTPYTLKQHIYNIHSGQNKRRKKRDSFIVSESSISPCNSKMQSLDIENVLIKAEPSDKPEVKYNQEAIGDQNVQFENQNELGNIFDQYSPNFFTNFPEQELANRQSFVKPDSNVALEKSTCGPKMNGNVASTLEQPVSNPMCINKVEHTSSKPYDNSLSAMLTNSVLPEEIKKNSNLEATAYDPDAELQSPWQVAGAAMRYLSDPSYTNVDEQFFSAFQTNFDPIPEEGTSFDSGQASVPNNSYSNSSYASNPMPVSNNSSLYHKNMSTALDNFQLNDFFQDSQTSNVMENQNWQHVDPKLLQHKCTTCRKSFSSEETLQVHISSIHGNLRQMPEQPFYAYDNMFPDNLANPANLKPIPNFPTLEQQEYNTSALSNGLRGTESKPEYEVPPNNNFFTPTFDNQFTDMSTPNSYNTLSKSYEESSFSSRVSDERSGVANFMQMGNTSVLPPNDNQIHICHICDSKFYSYDMKQNHMEQMHGIFLHQGREKETNQPFDMYPGTKQINKGNQFNGFPSKFCENRPKDELSTYNPSLSTVPSPSKDNFTKKQPHLLIERKSPLKDEYTPNHSSMHMLKSPDKTTSKKFSNRSAHVNSPILASVLSSPYLSNHSETIKIKTEPIEEMGTHLNSVLSGRNSYTLQQKTNITEPEGTKFTLDLSCPMCGKELSAAGHKKRHMRTVHKIEWPSTPEDIEAFNRKPKGLRKGYKERKPKAEITEKNLVNTAVSGHIVEPHKGVKENFTPLEINSRNSFYTMNRKQPPSSSSSIETNSNNQKQVTPISSAERHESPYPMPVLSPVPETTSVVSTSTVSSVPPGMPKIDILHGYKQNTRMAETSSRPNNQNRYTYMDQNINMQSPVNTPMANSFSGLKHSAHSFKDGEAPPFSKMLASMAKGNNVFKKDTLNHNHFVEASQTPTIVKVPCENDMPLGKNPKTTTQSSDYGNSFIKDVTEEQNIKVLGKSTMHLNKEPSISQNLSMLGESSRTVQKPYGSSTTDRSVVQSTNMQPNTEKDQLPGESQATSANQKQPPHIVHTNPKFIPQPKLGYKYPAVKLLRLNVPTTIHLNKIKTEVNNLEAVSPWSKLISKVFPPMREEIIKHESSTYSSEISVSGVNRALVSEESKNEGVQEAVTPKTDTEEVSSRASTSGKNRIVNSDEKCTKNSIRPTACTRASRKISQYEMINPEDIKKEYIENDPTDAENIANAKVIDVEATTSLMSDINKSSKTGCPKLFLQKIKSCNKNTKFQCYVPRKKRQKSIESSASDASLFSESVGSGTVRASTRCMIRLDRLKIAEKGIVTKETAKKRKRKVSAYLKKKAGVKNDMPPVKTRSKRQITNKKNTTTTSHCSNNTCKVLVEKVIPDQYENRELKRSPSIEEIIEIPKRKRSERNTNRPMIRRKERRRSSRLKEGSLLRKKESYLDDENTARSPIDLITIDD